jgi:hypothetical protein
VEAQLDQIILLLWIVLGLFGISSIFKIIHFFQHLNKEIDEAPDLYDLFEKDKLDEVIKESALLLSQRPNHVAALWCGAKAYFAQENFSKAKDLATRLGKVEPSLFGEVNEFLEAIEERKANE